MGNFLIVSKTDKLETYQQISKEYAVSFEINDFFIPSILDDEYKQNEQIEQYLHFGLPPHSTMHGVFLDIAIFSEDKKIREVSQYRMRQSMQIARKLALKGVVFHTNYNPYLPSPSYKDHFITTTCAYLSELLEEYPDIEIYLENMFDTQPDILEGISKRLCTYQNYGVCLDWAHIHAYGILSPDNGCIPKDAAKSRRQLQEEWVAHLHPYVKHIHINDNDFCSDLHLPVGDGFIDWSQFFAYYKKYFSNCSVLIETTNPDDQKKSLNYIRENFGLI